VKENNGYLKVLPFVEMNVSKLFIYLFDKHVLKWPRYYYGILALVGKANKL
jgi:hypothetical protein